MIGDIVQAEGAPGPTLVLHRDRLPAGALASRAELAVVRGWLERTGRGHIRKLALIGSSADPSYDLDYRFVQCLPQGFDFRAGCGHSLLAAVAGTGRPGAVRVRAVTTNDAVVCVPEPRGTHTVRLERTAGFADLLPTGRPAERLCGLSVSIVRYGNPYVFVDARDLGLHSERALFGAGPAVLGQLTAVRAAAARLLGMPPWGALPKVAAVGSYAPGRLSARAVTVSGWHPALALTGSICMAAGTVVPGTVPSHLARENNTACEAPSRTVRRPHRSLCISTRLGPVHVSADVTAERLEHVAVHGKRVRVIERAVPLPWRIHVTA
ncbi:PrpF domain-containing protein [Streptomyces sp. MJP52]|uniref:PrpF domain-containing protein n=1 Tax=Streptomyces sp. MJP52 TaxID=2940555 RepID=UPI0024730DA6|nr:PrpF domain-containing protein [Streptomyces sp. MJP52]MDH6223965.1 2-methylaconitate cis-trans-isomerase PrpF [Streptomyces sp. MJP52]